MRANSALAVRLPAWVLLSLGSCAGADRPETPAPAAITSPALAPLTRSAGGPLSAVDAQAFETMRRRLNAYVDLRKHLERKVAPLSHRASPEQVDAQERMLEKLLQNARASAKPGDIFTSEAQLVIRRQLAALLRAPDGKPLRDSIMEDNPVGLRLKVNIRYPVGAPVSTVPPQVLEGLPQLHSEMEYRFVGKSLIMFDTRANIVADFMVDALPR